MKVRCVIVAALIAAWGAAPAGAASWQRVTTPDGSSTDQVGLARTGDGLLHVAWHHPTGPNTEEQTREFVSRTLASQGERPRATFELAIDLKATGTLIGRQARQPSQYGR